MVLFTSRSSLSWGNLQVPHEASPQVFACYLFPTIKFLLLYRDFTMTQFEFFANREERWSDSMRALWGSLSICPLLLGRYPEAPGQHGLPPGEGRRCLRGQGLWHSPGVDQSSSGPGFYNGGGIGNSIHLHLPWTQLAIRPYPVI